jgi:uncharacterized protein (DUF983 family)
MGWFCKKREKEIVYIPRYVNEAPVRNCPLCGKKPKLYRDSYSMNIKCDPCRLSLYEHYSDGIPYSLGEYVEQWNSTIAKWNKRVMF